MLPLRMAKNVIMSSFGLDDLNPTKVFSEFSLRILSFGPETMGKAFFVAQWTLSVLVADSVIEEGRRSRGGC